MTGPPGPLLVVMPTLELGGAERHATWLAVHADRDRWEPRVLAFGDGPLRAELAAAGVTVSVLPLPRGGRALAAGAAVERALRRIRPGLVSGHHILVEVAVRRALRRMPAVERPPYLAWKHTYGHVGHRGLRERLFELATGGLVTRYGAVCHSQVRYLTGQIGLPAQKIAVVPNAVPVPPSCPDRAATSEPTVLMTAAMRADKDHALVLRAWPMVLAELPGARLRLAGDGPERRELERLAMRLGIADRVDFLGVRNDVERLLAASDLLVLASHTVECFPYAVLEAMAAGRGVVSTGVAGLPELVDDRLTGRLVAPREPVALAAALVEGLGDGAAAAARWGVAGWRRASTVFPLAAWAGRVNELLAEVAGVPGGSGSPGPHPRNPIPTRKS